MPTEFINVMVLVALTVLRLGLPLLGVWLISKALQYSLTVLP